MSDPKVEKEAGPTPDDIVQEKPDGEPAKKKHEYKDFGHDQEAKDQR